MKKRYLESTILHVVKPLYSIAEIGNYWFAIYLDYYKEKLGIKILSYDTYLLIIKNEGVNIGIIGHQTDSMLNVGIKTFMNKEEAEIIKAKFKIKS